MNYLATIIGSAELHCRKDPHPTRVWFDSFRHGFVAIRQNFTKFVPVWEIGTNGDENRKRFVKKILFSPLSLYLCIV
ncbi:hypothetical protein DLM86_24395 [Paenibacillus flagellatus]|uniref:Uncharacterized protein n=1 Tax=Paenibacillus flagellatus TaxID=2211139 RepID=A0A2V5JXI8_9BACL|nr:hypothetical protein DLM86_24395 [Paenibacillus flagellatus]